MREVGLGPGIAPIARFPYFRPKVVRFGTYFRMSDSRSIRRFRCLTCRHTFSAATGTPCFGQKKRRINEPLRKLLASGISLRRSALVLRVHRTTIARRLIFLGQQARRNLDLQLTHIRGLPGFQFDELETFEHVWTRPLERGGSIPLRHEQTALRNHTCAMLRANLNRLFRRTWCTTKKAEALAHHLAIYADYHNTVLTPP